MPVAEARLLESGQAFDAPVAEHGLSFLLCVCSGTTRRLLLFDTGSSVGSLVHNLNALRVDSAQIVSLELARHPNALELPATAIGVSEQTGSFVYVVTEDTLRRVQVKTGIGSAAQVEIISGLTGTEQVVKNVTPALVEGHRVKPQVITAGVPHASTQLAENTGT